MKIDSIYLIVPIKASNQRLRPNGMNYVQSCFFPELILIYSWIHTGSTYVKKLFLNILSIRRWIRWLGRIMRAFLCYDKFHDSGFILVSQGGKKSGANPIRSIITTHKYLYSQRTQKKSKWSPVRCANVTAGPGSKYT